MIPTKVAGKNLTEVSVLVLAMVLVCGLVVGASAPIEIYPALLANRRFELILS